MGFKHFGGGAKTVGYSVELLICPGGHGVLLNCAQPCSDGGEDQGAEEALVWGMKKTTRRFIHVSFGNSRLARAAPPFQRAQVPPALVLSI